VPGWEGLNLDDRRASARARVATWQAFNEGETVVRVWLPEGPGSKLLFNALATDWRGIGVVAERVADARAADLRLVDAVAPAGSAIWYLTKVACPAPAACSEDAQAALAQAREARSLAERGLHLAAADRAVTESALYIPIARPLRWSLVAPRLVLFRENARAIHPLNRLRRPPR
jgi:peptide/nickel transport system substrate-binding protein